ncbi:L-serine ammonia-lyase [Aestuariirhabdus litorea]|uniref:L-serine dehydratase n=1 Tax=Aestuariirhabdus litorea TaxID=2528527 RepID=A0A3P3VMX7_9GAMM|nr:L-serine ammonia-lyase [Aestuariirhabdus litorea]RRJ83006.1 L-serine ammonia-lyase [Aestuariirhabdus litorea]RWW93682.1 L-serine ammonia-lyase [Endozoicomonadaceae bacterium GTF-13]
MSLSLFDLFKVGIGPSSSHTVGPMWAAHRFLAYAEALGLLAQSARVRVSLYGSLAMTGKGHGTDTAVLLGLSGECPDRIDPDAVAPLLERIRAERSLRLGGQWPVAFDESRDLCFLFGESLPQHPNGLCFELFDGAGIQQLLRRYFSVGGGFVLCEDEIAQPRSAMLNHPIPYPFETGLELLQRCRESGLSIAGVVLANERAMRSADEVESRLREIWQVMEASIERGCRERGELPGGLGLRRRAHRLREELVARPEATMRDPLNVMDWINLYAMAVNEENAAGGRVVTAPTNGAAGVIPAVLAYYNRFMSGANEQGIFTFLCTAAAIGMLYKKNASISAAEVGCQGEVGVACSMAAAGLAAVMGGSNEQIENAAEIGMEHNLGLTCDPIAGLVQVPCIERNTMGAVKAVNAARLALRGDGSHQVPLDSVIETMRQTGADMQQKYKETAEGGLAVNVVAC